MQTQTQSIVNFYNEKKITKEIALQYANRPDEVAKKI
jgi:Tfp pilus assembly pilus retraction ATPase PilT